MVELVRFPLESGGSVSFELEESPGMVHAGRAGTIIREAGESFERALGEVRNAASVTLGQFRSMTQRPDEVEITFGVKVDAEAGAIIAKTGMQGQFEIRLKWVHDASATPDPDPIQDEAPA